MPEIFMDVDTALAEVPVNVMPLIDDTDFKTRETALAYNQAGMDLVWNFVTSAGAFTQTAVTPTTAGNYDWTHQGDGMYTIEIPASGGASVNNDTEGYGWFTGICTGVLPWRGPVIGFRAAAINDALCDGGDNLDVNTVQVSGTAQTAGDLAALITTVDTVADAINAKTGNLPTDPADQSALEAAITAATSPLATAANLATVAGYIDTEIAAIDATCIAIKAKTDNLPADPVSTALFTGADSELATVPTTAGSLLDKIRFLFQYFRNKKTVTATTETLLKEDATTTLGTATVSDDGTTFTKGEMS